MKTNEFAKTDKDIQMVLNRLISEEWIASIMYKQFIVAACCKEERHQIKDLLIEISDDEMDDHYLKLVKFAAHNGYSAPCQIREYVKYASKDTVKQFESWKKDRNALYYVEQSIKSEIEAIHSYEYIMENYDIPYDLLQILISNLYDEQEHLRKLTSLNIILGTGANYEYA